MVLFYTIAKNDCVMQQPLHADKRVIGSSENTDTISPYHRASKRLDPSDRRRSRTLLRRFLRPWTTFLRPLQSVKAAGLISGPGTWDTSALAIPAQSLRNDADIHGRRIQKSA